MKRFIIITLYFLMISTVSWADKYYVCLAKESQSSKKPYNSRIKRGDVAFIERFTPGHNPTRAEKDRCVFVVVDLNTKDLSDIFEPMYKDNDPEGLLLDRRKIKIDIDSISQEELSKGDFKKKFIDRSKPVVNNN